MVRSRPVPIETGRFDWTDDIHMALYLAERGEAVAAIAGDHDVLCSRSLETVGTQQGKFWAEQWQRGHWNPAGGTPSRY